MNEANVLPAMWRFWDKVDSCGPWSLRHGVPGRCWLWTGAKQRGYGAFRIGGRAGKTIRAHRYTYERLRGPIPDGMESDHLCRVPACVNPAHMEAVPHRVNLLRGNTFAARLAAVTHCPDGHEYTPENTYVRTDGHGRRNCKECSRRRHRERSVSSVRRAS